MPDDYDEPIDAEFVTLPPLPTAGGPVRPFRPTARPPVAVLTACDDGRTEGEDFRLRGDRFVIGRSEGDLLLPHDDRVSSRHVEIVRELADGQYRWVVTDLGSRNGLFVRARRTPLAHGTEFLIGGGRYTFEAALGVPDEPYTGGENTRLWSAPAMPDPALVEAAGGRWVLSKQEYWIGTDAGCDISREGDPFASPRHARLVRTPKGWRAENNKAPNGLWVRRQYVRTAGGACDFQIGEQRFRLRTD